jgi:hypothetical protein
MKMFNLFDLIKKVENNDLTVTKREALELSLSLNPKKGQNVTFYWKDKIMWVSMWDLEFEIKEVVRENKNKIDLVEYLRNEKEAFKFNDFGKTNGQQLEALEFYLDDRVEIINQIEVKDLHMEYYAILNFEGIIILWRGDAYDDNLSSVNGYEYIKNSLSGKDTKQFKNLKGAKKYIRETEEPLWKDFPEELFEDDED